MTDAEALDSSSYPIVTLPTQFRDDRGLIANIFTDGMQSGAIITSKKGSRRADHYHRTGNHLCVLLSGSLLYRWRKTGTGEPWNSVTVKVGQAFYSPAMTDHQMLMLEDSVFLAFDSKVARDHKKYEEDIVRFPVSDAEKAADAELMK